MADRNQLSPGGAIVMGLLFAACGAIPMVLGLHTRPAQTSDSAPAWVGIAIPFLWAGTRAGDVTGRIAFGLASLLIAILFVAAGFAGARQLRRARGKLRD
ncbi:MAG TPA: hypothetical protein VHB25_14600 [Gemmatimonadaceae bacterium]|nr:hypothetical protein [Gemmatimonadaceae bacterium]